MRALVTGGAGFFGGILLQKLLSNSWDCVSIDLKKHEFSHLALTVVQGDIRDPSLLDSLFKEHAFDVVFHCAAILAHDTSDTKFLWSSNVEGTREIAKYAKRYKVARVIYTSSNCLWGAGMDRPVREDDTPQPVEIYGQSKWEAEKILQGYSDSFHAICIRCPTIIDAGRLGLLAILFEFIAENRRVWVVGSGENRYQFIYALDLAQAMIKAVDYHGSDTFGIGSDEVTSLRETYEYVIDKAGSRSKVASLPRALTLAAMKLAYHLGLSPLGPYHYKMIAESFSFDTSRIKERLHWQPTLTNGGMLFKAYEYYQLHRDEIGKRTDASAHRRAASMGIIRLLKWLS